MMIAGSRILTYIKVNGELFKKVLNIPVEEMGFANNAVECEPIKKQTRKEYEEELIKQGWDGITHSGRGEFKTISNVK